uniref:Palmitoyltransferase n=1 Tax=Corethrella appendiculata TaxID=1370023 RepID=U5EV60_9DIPT
MKIRKFILPRTVQDIAATSFLSCCIPITFWFEVWIVLPDIHGYLSFFHVLHCIPAIFLLFNITTNFLAILMCDTSIQTEIINVPPNTQIDSTSSTKTWHLCAMCETVVPPRSWHCNVCKACILKRDHHCVFTGCCIGHKNHRYFIIFVFYLFIATTYSCIYNNYFIWVQHGEEFRTWTSFVKIIFPLAMLMIDTSVKQYYLVIYLINMIGMFFTGVLLIYHGRLILNGAVVHERKSPEYNLGKWENLKMVLGERWYFALLSPFMESRLPHNGVNWETILKETTKNR